MKGEYANGECYNANFTEKSIYKNVFLSKEEAENRMMQMVRYEVEITD